jgi:hypothetical protein
MTEYYDLILGLIPLSLIGVTATLSVLGFSITSAVPLAAGIPVALIGHVLFVNSPVDDTQSSSETVDSSSSSAYEPAD